MRNSRILENSGTITGETSTVWLVLAELQVFLEKESRSRSKHVDLNLNKHIVESSITISFQICGYHAPNMCSHPLGNRALDFGCPIRYSGFTGQVEHRTSLSLSYHSMDHSKDKAINNNTHTQKSRPILDHRKSMLARGSRWDITPLPF